MANISSINRIFLDSGARTSQKRHSRAYLKWLQQGLARLSQSFMVTVFSLTMVGLTVLISVPSPSLADAALPTEATSGEMMSVVDNGADIAAEKIDQFSQAYLQVLQLLSDREAEIPAAETNAEALKIEKSIEADAIAIIQEQGLTLPEYMQILGLASQDATFQDKVLGRMDDTQEEP